MILQLGSFSFESSEVWFIPTQRAVVGQTGRYTHIDHNWTIHCPILSTSLDELKSKTQAREAGVFNITGDVVFKEDDGTETQHKIVYGNTINGIRATAVTYPGGLTSYGGRVFGSGSEMADSTKTYRYMVLQLTARELVLEFEIVFYWQSYRYSVGGTQFAVQGAFQGLPRRFNTMQSSPCWALQRGRAIGLTATPSAALPIPSGLAMDPERSWVEPITPKFIGNLRQTHFGAEWNYFFKDPLPMPGIPADTP